jgi:hypothetical protein
MPTFSDPALSSKHTSTSKLRLSGVGVDKQTGWTVTQTEVDAVLCLSRILAEMLEETVNETKNVVIRATLLGKSSSGIPSNYNSPFIDNLSPNKTLTRGIHFILFAIVSTHGLKLL